MTKNTIVTKLVADDASYGSSIDRAVAKNKRYQKSAQKTVKSSGQLGSGFRSAATSVAVIDGPLGGVAGRLGSVGAALNSTGLLFGALGIAVAGATTIMAKAVGVGEEYERQQLRTAALLKSTGYAAGLSAQSMEDQARALALSTLASTEGVRDAQNVLTSFRSISDSNNKIFSRTLTIAQDMAATFGGDLKGATLQLGKALEDPAKGLTALSRSGVSFTDTERDMITSMFNAGQVAEAQGLILDKLQKQVGGAGAAEAGGLSGATDTLGQKWDELLVSFNNATNAGPGVSKFLNNLSGGLDGAAQRVEAARILAESGSEATVDPKAKAGIIAKPWELAMDQVRESRKTITQQIQKIEALPAIKGQAAFVTKEREQQLQSLNKLSEKYLQQYNRIFDQYVKKPAQDQLTADKKGLEAQNELKLQNQTDQNAKQSKKDADALAKQQMHSANLLTALDLQLASQDGKLTMAYEKRQSQINSLALSEQQIQATGYQSLEALQTEYLARNQQNYDAAQEAKKLKEQEALDNERLKASEWLVELQTRNATELEQFRLQKESEQLVAQEYLEKGLLMDEEYQQAQLEIDKKYDALRNQSQLKQKQMMLSNAGKLFGSMADLTGAFAGEQSGIYKAMFAVSKAFAIADSIVKIQQGIASAAALPFPANIGAMATVAAQTASIVTTISGTQLSGMAHDGIDSVPKEGTWLLDRGERVVDSRTNEDLKSYLSSTRSANQPIQQITFAPQIVVEAGASQSDDEELGERSAQMGYNMVLEDLQTNGPIRQALG